MKNIFEIYEGILDKRNKNNVGKQISIGTIQEYLDKNFTTNKKFEIYVDDETGQYAVDCEGNVLLKNRSAKELTNGTFIWGNVWGCFDLYGYKGKDLIGCPKRCESLSVVMSEIESLDGISKQITYDIDLSYSMNLKSLRGFPERCGSVILKNCMGLTSLEGLPNKINGYLDCEGCANIKSLKGFPKLIQGNLYAFGLGDNTTLKATQATLRQVVKLGGEIYTY